MDTDLPVLAGTISTAIFTLSMLPMLAKAARTRELRSYSLSNLLLSNAGNVINSVYVFHLPVGPIWVLHAFYLITAALMLVWYLRWVACRLCPALCRGTGRYGPITQGGGISETAGSSKKTSQADAATALLIR